LNEPVKILVEKLADCLEEATDIVVVRVRQVQVGVVFLIGVVSD